MFKNDFVQYFLRKGGGNYGEKLYTISAHNRFVKTPSCFFNYFLARGFGIKMTITVEPNDILLPPKIANSNR